MLEKGLTWPQDEGMRTRIISIIYGRLRISHSTRVPATKTTVLLVELYEFVLWLCGVVQSQKKDTTTSSIVLRPDEGKFLLVTIVEKSLLMKHIIYVPGYIISSFGVINYEYVMNVIIVCHIHMSMYQCSCNRSILESIRTPMDSPTWPRSGLKYPSDKRAQLYSSPCGSIAG